MDTEKVEQAQHLENCEHLAAHDGHNGRGIILFRKVFSGDSAVDAREPAQENDDSDSQETKVGSCARLTWAHRCLRVRLALATRNACHAHDAFANHPLTTFEALACKAQPRTFATTTRGHSVCTQHVHPLELTFPHHLLHGYPEVWVRPARVQCLITRRASRLTLERREPTSLTLFTISLSTRVTQKSLVNKTNTQERSRLSAAPTRDTRNARCGSKCRCGAWTARFAHEVPEFVAELARRTQTARGASLRRGVPTSLACCTRGATSATLKLPRGARRALVRGARAANLLTSSSKTRGALDVVLHADKLVQLELFVALLFASSTASWAAQFVKRNVGGAPRMAVVDVLVAVSIVAIRVNLCAGSDWVLTKGKQGVPSKVHDQTLAPNGLSHRRKAADSPARRNHGFVRHPNDNSSGHHPLHALHLSSYKLPL